jgi:hypothetical protein
MVRFGRCLLEKAEGSWDSIRAMSEEAPEDRGDGTSQPTAGTTVSHVWKELKPQEPEQLRLLLLRWSARATGGNGESAMVSR